jgi:acetolactate synthase-1/2/3 large subunit
VLPPYSVEHFAATTGAHYLKLGTDAELDRVLTGALERTRRGQVVMVEVAIDYSRKTFFTRGASWTTFWRLPMGDRLRMLGRAVRRRLG